jgi:hypothetical protein
MLDLGVDLPDDQLRAAFKKLDRSGNGTIERKVPHFLLCLLVAGDSCRVRTLSAF